MFRVTCASSNKTCHYEEFGSLARIKFSPCSKTTVNTLRYFLWPYRRRAKFCWVKVLVRPDSSSKLHVTKLFLPFESFNNVYTPVNTSLMENSNLESTM